MNSLSLREKEFPRTANFLNERVPADWDRRPQGYGRRAYTDVFTACPGPQAPAHYTSPTVVSATRKHKTALCCFATLGGLAKSASPPYI